MTHTPINPQHQKPHRCWTSSRPSRSAGSGCAPPPSTCSWRSSPRCVTVSVRFVWYLFLPPKPNDEQTRALYTRGHPSLPLPPQIPHLQPHPTQLPKWREVVKVRTLMRAYKVTPDTASYTWVITAHLALGRVYDATRLLAEMGDEGECILWRLAVVRGGGVGLRVARRRRRFDGRVWRIEPHIPTNTHTNQQTPTHQQGWPPRRRPSRSGLSWPSAPYASRRASGGSPRSPTRPRAWPPLPRPRRRWGSGRRRGWRGRGQGKQEGWIRRRSRPFGRRGGGGGRGGRRAEPAPGRRRRWGIEVWVWFEGM